MVNRWVFRRLRKVSSDGADVTSGGRLFQTWGAEAGQALSPTVDRLDCGWRRRLVARLAGGVFSAVRSSICSSAIKLVNTLFCKQINRFWCKLAQVVRPRIKGPGQLWASGDGQTSRSHKAGDRFGSRRAIVLDLVGSSRFSNLQSVMLLSYLLRLFFVYGSLWSETNKYIDRLTDWMFRHSLLLFGIVIYRKS